MDEFVAAIVFTCVWCVCFVIYLVRGGDDE
jgi:hypothetical protein